MAAEITPGSKTTVSTGVDKTAGIYFILITYLPLQHDIVEETGEVRLALL